MRERNRRPHTSSIVAIMKPIGHVDPRSRDRALDKSVRAYSACVRSELSLLRSVYYRMKRYQTVCISIHDSAF